MENEKGGEEETDNERRSSSSERRDRVPEILFAKRNITRLFYPISLVSRDNLALGINEMRIIMDDNSKKSSDILHRAFKSTWRQKKEGIKYRGNSARMENSLSTTLSPLKFHYSRSELIFYDYSNFIRVHYASTMPFLCILFTFRLFQPNSANYRSREFIQKI